MTRGALRMLIFAYASAVIVALLLLFSAQGLIQWTLAREIHLRSVAAQINAQEIRTQRMFYNVLLLQNPTGHGIDYNAIAALVAADEPTWAATQQAMYAPSALIGLVPGDFDAPAQAVLAREQAGFLKMEAAYARVLAMENAGHPASPDAVRPDVGRIYLAEGPYLNALIAIYTDDVASADSLINVVRIIEIALFVATLLTISCEVVFVVRPALRQIEDQMTQMEQAIHNKKEGNV